MGNRVGIGQQEWRRLLFTRHLHSLDEGLTAVTQLPDVDAGSPRGFVSERNLEPIDAAGANNLYCRIGAGVEQEHERTFRAIIRFARAAKLNGAFTRSKRAFSRLRLLGRRRLTGKLFP